MSLFKRHFLLSPVRKFAWIPVKSHLSHKWLWMEYVYHAMIIHPRHTIRITDTDPEMKNIYWSEKENLIELLKK